MAGTNTACGSFITTPDAEQKGPVRSPVELGYFEISKRLEI